MKKKYNPRLPKFTDETYQYHISAFGGGYYVNYRRVGQRAFLLTPRGLIPYTQALMIVRLLAEGDDIIDINFPDGAHLNLDVKEFIDYWESEMIDRIEEDTDRYGASVNDCLILLGLLDG